MTTYFAVLTRPNCEPQVAARLRDRSFHVYFPQCLPQSLRYARPTRMPRPFLPGVVFVRDDQRGTMEIERVSGVVCVQPVGSSLEPRHIPSLVIDLMKAREDGQGFVQLGVAAPMSVTGLLRADTATKSWFALLFRQMKGETRFSVFISLLERGDLELVKEAA